MLQITLIHHLQTSITAGNRQGIVHTLCIGEQRYIVATFYPIVGIQGYVLEMVADEIAHSRQLLAG